MALSSILDPVLSPLLTLDSWLAILIISIVITIITTIAYKYLTDQAKIKKLKEDMKKDQKKLKVLMKENPEKAQKLQKDIMGRNSELMKHSFKPTLYTLIPLLIIFGWLNAHMAYEPLHAQEAFTVTLDFIKGSTGNVTLSYVPELMIKNGESLTKSIVNDQVAWTLKGDVGDYQLTFALANGVSVQKDILISNQTGQYSPPFTSFKGEQPFKSVTISNEKIHPLSGFPIVGNWGWIGIYILFSFALSFGLRKAMNVS